MIEPQVKGNVLLVSAEPELVDAATELLTARRHQVRVAGTGRQALELMRHTSVDIVLLSINLPDMEARQVCQYVQDADRPPLLVLRQDRSSEAVEEVLPEGAADVLMTPSELPLLVARVETHLQLAALRRELAHRDLLLEQEAAERRLVEESVRDAEVSGQELVENLSEVIYIANTDGVLTYVSPGVERLLGYSPEEIVGQHISDFVEVQARDHLATRLGRVLAGQREANEYRLITKTGDSRWAQSSSQPVLEDDQVVGLQGVLTDITERKQAEVRIRQQNEFLTTVIESLTHPFYVMNVDDYTIQMANSAARVESLAGVATCYALTHHRDAPCSTADHPCPIEELRKTGRPVRVEHVHYNPEGQERFVEVHSYPLFDEQGKLVRAIEYTLDITERKQAEEQLRESEARWRSVTENSPDHVILLDRDLNIQFVNYASPGLTLDELLGTPLYALVAEEQQQGVRETLERVLETYEPATYETSYETPEGEIIYYESRAVPRAVEGQVVGLAVNARDITEHKRSEQALRDAMETAEQARLAEHERRQEADQRRRVAESLADVMAALNSNQSLDQILDHIAAQAMELLDNELVAIYSLTEAGRELILQAVQGQVPQDLQAISRSCHLPAIGQALAARQTLVTDDLEEVYSGAGGQPEAAFRAVLVVPVILQDEAYGGLVMCSTEPRSYSAEEAKLAAVFGNQVALAVESSRLREQREQAAAAAERNRLARDLHDSVTQALFSATLVAEVLPQIGERDADLAREGLEELGALTRGALAEMRTMLLELRPTAVVETRLSDLVRQLTDAITSRAGMLVSQSIDPSPTLPPDVHVTFYRVAQEALNNVLKHAGATRVAVSLVASPPADIEEPGAWQGQLTLSIADDGQGFDGRSQEPDHLGLGIMRERAETIGGELKLESEPGRGTRVSLVWTKEPTAAT